MGRSGNYPQISGHQPEGRLLIAAVHDSIGDNGHSRLNASRPASHAYCPMPVALLKILPYFTRN